MDMGTLGYFIFMDEQEKKAQQQEDDNDSGDDESWILSIVSQVRLLRYLLNVYFHHKLMKLLILSLASALDSMEMRFFGITDSPP